MSEIISREGWLALVDHWLGQGKRIVGPVQEQPGFTRFAQLTDAARLALDGFVHPANTAKDLVLPKTEKLYDYQREGNSVRLSDVPVPSPETILIARPCDAAAFPIVDKVMNWDYQDSQYNRRRAGLSVLTLACTEWDEACFCTSVRLGPADQRGSDALLLALGDGSYQVRTLTDRGQQVFDGHLEPSAREAQVPCGPDVRVDLDQVQEVLRSGFDSPIWRQAGLRCVGCGSCTYTCPTCHCFDLVDESHGASGCRVRNWDACQFALFTAHASGHNPRADQAARQRQRSTHKFVIYPEKFGDYLCTGCGNCFRNCPVNLGVLNILQAAAGQPVPVEG